MMTLVGFQLPLLHAKEVSLRSLVVPSLHLHKRNKLLAVSNNARCKTGSYLTHSNGQMLIASCRERLHSASSPSVFFRQRTNSLYFCLKKKAISKRRLIAKETSVLVYQQKCAWFVAGKCARSDCVVLRRLLTAEDIVLRYAHAEIPESCNHDRFAMCYFSHRFPYMTHQSKAIKKADDFGIGGDISTDNSIVVVLIFWLWFLREVF